MSYITRSEIQTFLPKYKQVFNMIDILMDSTSLNWIYYSCFDDFNLCVHILISDKGDLVYVSKRKFTSFDYDFDFIKRRFDYENICLCPIRDVDVAREQKSVAKSQIIKAIDTRLLKIHRELNPVSAP